MKRSIFTLVALLALSAPALAQDGTASGSTTTTESTNTQTTAPANQTTTTTTTRKPAPVRRTTTTNTTTRRTHSVGLRPTHVSHDTVVTPNGASSTTTVTH